MAWPFKTISRVEITQLPEKLLQRLEQTMRTRLAELMEDMPPAGRVANSH